MNLAINGGKKVRTTPFPKQITIGEEEKNAVMRVLNSKRLSAYRGCWLPNFWGGPEIQALVEEFKEKMGVKYAIPCNSCTSGIQIALGAVGVENEYVFVTPWSMSCSASAPYIWGGRPIFVDIDKNYYMLDPLSILDQLQKFKAKAIIMVDLFGQPYNGELINTIAKGLNIKIIEDAAQAIGSTYKGKYAGTLGDIGVYSFTQGKHLTAGEGGMIVTDNEELAMKCQLIMNHSEAVIHDIPKETQDNYTKDDFHQIPGYNMRMTEIQAAILREQLKKLDKFVAHRRSVATYLENTLTELPFIISSPERENCKHSYYVQAFKFDANKAGIHRNKFIDAVRAELMPETGRETEGVPIGSGYIDPLCNFPLFTSRGVLGSHCPNAHDLYRDELFLHRLCGFDMEEEDLYDVTNAFYKVAENIKELK